MKRFEVVRDDYCRLGQYDHDREAIARCRKENRRWEGSGHHCTVVDHWAPSPGLAELLARYLARGKSPEWIVERLLQAGFDRMVPPSRRNG